MIRALAVLLLGLLLCGGACTRNVRKVPAQCDAMCAVPCVAADGDTGVRWDADPTKAEAWDELAEDTVIDQLAGKLRTCEVRRRACHQCLLRLDRAGVIEYGD